MKLKAQNSRRGRGDWTKEVPSPPPSKALARIGNCSPYPWPDRMNPIPPRRTNQRNLLVLARAFATELERELPVDVLPELPGRLPADASERIQGSGVAKMTGMSARWIRAKAAEGHIPSAIKIGAIWTFDEAIVRAWVREKEAETCQDIKRHSLNLTTSTNEAKTGTAEWLSMERSYVAAYELRINAKRERNAKRGSRK